MYIVIKGGRPTDWYSSHLGLKYKVIHEGSDEYLVDSDAMGKAWRIVNKHDCEKDEGGGELFCEQVKQHDAHYDNKNGSLYKFAEDHGLNAWEFDIIKRIARCRKKGQFKEDLEKTKRVIDLYLKEYESTKLI
jgi:hypothetical protein